MLLSGGDPLVLEDTRLGGIPNALRAIPHVEIIPFGTRVPCTLPQRVTPELTGLLQNFHPLYVNIHFNHSLEITAEAALGCRTVPLKGFNGDLRTLQALMRKRLTIRVKAYYLFHGRLRYIERRCII